MRIAIHKEALSELKGATAWYCDIEMELGRDFKLAFKEAVENILDQPLRYRVVFGDLRKCGLRRFPYDLYFRISGEVIRILIVKLEEMEMGVDLGGLEIGDIIIQPLTG